MGQVICNMNKYQCILVANKGPSMLLQMSVANYVH